VRAAELFLIVLILFEAGGIMMAGKTNANYRACQDATVGRGKVYQRPRRPNTNPILLV
jgi:hypothetical protein